MSDHSQLSDSMSDYNSIELLLENTAADASITFEEIMICSEIVPLGF